MLHKNVSATEPGLLQLLALASEAGLAALVDVPAWATHLQTRI